MVKVSKKTFRHRRLLQNRRLLLRTEEFSLGLLRHTLVYLEVTVGAGTPGMHNTFGNTFPVKMCQFFDQVDILEKAWPMLPCHKGVWLSETGTPWFVVRVFLAIFTNLQMAKTGCQ